jgi:hypothetical protein
MNTSSHNILTHEDRIAAPINPLSQKLSWSLVVPASFASTPPLFSFGEFVPLAEEDQPTEGITYFGVIVGILYEFDELERCFWWRYTIRLPDYYPEGERDDWMVFYDEEEIIALMKSI